MAADCSADGVLCPWPTDVGLADNVDDLRSNPAPGVVVTEPICREGVCGIAATLGLLSVVGVADEGIDEFTALFL